MNKLLTGLTLGCCLVASPALAGGFAFTFNLDCGQANAGAGTCASGASGGGIGTASFNMVNNEFTWEVSFSGLSSAVTEAHFHGPAARGENASIVVPIGTESPGAGSVILGFPAAADLRVGKWYLDIHTLNFPDGEIRGQVQTFNTPGCDLQLDRGSYGDGDTVNAIVYRISNPGLIPALIELKVWLKRAGSPPAISVFNVGSDGSIGLAPGVYYDFGPLPLFTVDPSLPRGTWEAGCRLIDPTTGFLLVEDLNVFEIF